MARRDIAEKLRLITEEIDGALELLGESASDARDMAPDQPPESLMEQCLALCDERVAPWREAVRTVHHFACTGGTLFSKCIAAMPNVQLLSEVDPFSTLHLTSKPKFAPSDLIRQMKQSTRGVDDDVVGRLFVNNIEVIHRDATLAGYRLVLRDHPHGAYCVGPRVASRPPVRRLLEERFDVVSVVTARHPVQSWLSLQRQGWHEQLKPATFGEYCARYVAFMRDHAGLPVFRYEDLLGDPHATMQRLCAALDLPYSDQFPALFGGFSLTGDSGRSSSTLAPRPDWPVPDDLAAEVLASRDYPALMSALGYG